MKFAIKVNWNKSEMKKCIIQDNCNNINNNDNKNNDDNNTIIIIVIIITIIKLS